MNNQTRRYSDSEKLQIIEEYMNSGESMETFQAKYGMGHCTLSRWMTNFGLQSTTQKQYTEMRKRIDESPEKTLRERALEAKVAQLEKDLMVERLKTEAANAMIEVAEEELGIDIRKKAGAKQ
jgi:transposase